MLRCVQVGFHVHPYPHCTPNPASPFPFSTHYWYLFCRALLRHFVAKPRITLLIVLA